MIEHFICTCTEKARAQKSRALRKISVDKHLSGVSAGKTSPSEVARSYSVSVVKGPRAFSGARDNLRKRDFPSRALPVLL